MLEKPHFVLYSRPQEIHIPTKGSLLAKSCYEVSYNNSIQSFESGAQIKISGEAVRADSLPVRADSLAKDMPVDLSVPQSRPHHSPSRLILDVRTPGKAPRATRTAPTPDETRLARA